eukprot:9007449-Lingulodinium_polyedra.AAC.1
MVAGPRPAAGSNGTGPPGTLPACSPWSARAASGSRPSSACLAFMPRTTRSRRTSTSSGDSR